MCPSHDVEPHNTNERREKSRGRGDEIIKYLIITMHIDEVCNDI